jgi:hypothetical protein
VRKESQLHSFEKSVRLLFVCPCVTLDPRQPDPRHLNRTAHLHTFKQREMVVAFSVCNRIKLSLVVIEERNANCFTRPQDTKCNALRTSNLICISTLFLCPSTNLLIVMTYPFSLISYLSSSRTGCEYSSTSRLVSAIKQRDTLTQPQPQTEHGALRP